MDIVPPFPSPHRLCPSMGLMAHFYMPLTHTPRHAQHRHSQGVSHRVQHEAVDATRHGQDQHGGTAIERIASGHQVPAWLQSILFGRLISRILGQEKKHVFVLWFFFPVQPLSRCSPNETGPRPRGAFLHTSVISWFYHHSSLPTIPQTSCICILLSTQGPSPILLIWYSLISPLSLSKNSMLSCQHPLI